QAGMVRHWLKAGRALRTLRHNHEERGGNDTRSQIIAEGDLLNGIHVSVTPEAIAGRNPIDVEVTRREASRWRTSIVINGLGAIATSIVLVVLIMTKFVHGAWIVIVLIPTLVMV